MATVADYCRDPKLFHKKFGPLETQVKDEKTKYRSAQDMILLMNYCKDEEVAEVLAEDPCAFMYDCTIVPDRRC